MMNEMTLTAGTTVTIQERDAAIRTATVVRTSKRGIVLIRFTDSGKTAWAAPQALTVVQNVD